MASSALMSCKNLSSTGFKAFEIRWAFASTNMIMIDMKDYERFGNQLDDFQNQLLTKSIYPKSQGFFQVDGFHGPKTTPFEPRWMEAEWASERSGCELSK